jgi:hypothetical protein
MTEEVQGLDVGYIQTPDTPNLIQWKITLAGPFVIGRCSEVLANYYSDIPDVSSENLPPSPDGVGNEFVYNPDIGFVIQGAFEVSSEELVEPFVATAGELMSMWRYQGAHVIKALAPLNSYVCITPRENKNQIWNRSLVHVSAGVDSQLTSNESVDQYVFVAKGVCTDQNGIEYSTNGLYKLDPTTTYTFSSFMSTYLIHIWK